MSCELLAASFFKFARKLVFITFIGTIEHMPFHRNFTYWIDKRGWKYYFLVVALELDR
jgi:hypothetical protein